jgi:hypothetical protein
MAPRLGSGAIHASVFYGRDGSNPSSVLKKPEPTDLLQAELFAHLDIGVPSFFWNNAIPERTRYLGDITTKGLETWCIEELRHAKEKQFDPNKILVVLVGEIEEPSALKILATHLGQHKPANGIQPQDKGIRREVSSQASKLIESKSVEITSRTKTEVIVVWPIQPMSSDQLPYLEVYAELLTGTQTSRLTNLLVGEMEISNTVRAMACGYGGQAKGIFIIRADVTEGHTVGEVRRVIQSEIQRTVKEGSSALNDIEIIRAANRMNTKQAMQLADATGLTIGLADAHECGDWTKALKQVPEDILTEPQTIMDVLRTVFEPDAEYSILVERDMINSPPNQIYAHLATILSRSLADKITDTTKREALIRETIRQFGLMPTEMRSRYLQLLQSQLQNPKVLRLAEGVKLLPTVAGFGVTSGKSILYSSKAEDSERSGASVRRGFATTSTGKRGAVR